MKNTFVYSKLKVEGTHYWPNCDIPSVEYLKYPHRHLFTIKVMYKVSHDDRDIEFINERYNILNFLKQQFLFNLDLSIFEFGSNSCESIASCIFDCYDKKDKIVQIEVNEDDENGAILRRE